MSIKAVPHFQFRASRTTPNGRTLDKERLVTTCTLTDAFTGFTIARGEAMLNPSEPFDADIARQVSTGRALKRVEQLGGKRLASAIRLV